MKQQIDVLDKDIADAQHMDVEIFEQAVAWRDNVFKAMNELRETVDTVETLVDADYWPIPTYVDLLFGI